MWKWMPGLLLIASTASASPFEGPRKTPCKDCFRVKRVAIPKAARRTFRAIEVRSTASETDRWGTDYWLAVRTAKGWWVQYIGGSGEICGFDHVAFAKYELPTFKVGASSISFDGKTCRFDRDAPSCD